MSTCQAWATSSQFRHPWLEPTSMKRKRRDCVRDNSDPPPSSKRRRRYSNIEDGFSYLSLNGNSAPFYGNHANSVSVEEIPPPVPMDAEMSFPPSHPIQPAYIVEEPTIPEINMKTLSWFEPERDRIIITDLDSFTQSDDEYEQPSMAVNTALLDKIRAKVVDESASSLLSATTSQALVLFRPPPWASAVNEEAKSEQKETKIHRQVDVKLDEEDMAMEVEL